MFKLELMPFIYFSRELFHCNINKLFLELLLHCLFVSPSFCCVSYICCPELHWWCSSNQFGCDTAVHCDVRLKIGAYFSMRTNTDYFAILAHLKPLAEWNSSIYFWNIFEEKKVAERQCIFFQEDPLAPWWAKWAISRLVHLICVWSPVSFDSWPLV